MAFILKSPSNQYNETNTQFSDTAVVLDNDGTLRAQQVKISGYPVEGAFGYQATGTAGAPGYTVTNYRYVGYFAGYQFGGRTTATSTVATTINKLPFASEANIYAVPGVLNAATDLSTVGKSATRAYILGGRTTPPSPVARALDRKIFPFAIGEVYGSYLSPTTITTTAAPLGLLESQTSSDISGGKIFVSSGGGLPGATNSRLIYIPTTVDTDVAVDYGALNTARRLTHGFSDELNSKGIIAAGLADAATPVVTETIESFPFAVASPSIVQSNIPGTGIYRGSVFQSVTTGYFGNGTNSPLTAPVIESNFRVMNMYRFPFSSYTTVSSITTSVQNTVIEQCGFSSTTDGYMVGGWPGNPTSSTAPANVIKYQFSSDTMLQITSAATPYAEKWRFSRQGTQD